MRSFRLVTLAFLASSLFVVGISAVTEKRTVGQFSTPPQSRAILGNEKKIVRKLPKNNAGSDDDDVIALASRGGAAAASAKDAVTGAVIMALIERGLNKVFVSQGIKFPAQLGGCIALFTFLILADAVSPGLGESIFTSLSPGSALLAKWLPVFFVPGLVMLPLAPSVGSSLEVVKVLLVVVLGWSFTLSTVTYSVLSLRTAQGTVIKAPPVAPVAKKGRGKAPPAAPVAPAKPFSDETMAFLLKGSVLMAAVSIGATKMGNDFATPLQTVFLLLSSFASYVWAARLPAGFNKTVHPLITATVLSLGLLQATGLATGSAFIDVLKSYKVGSLSLMKAGAGDLLLFLLNPAVVSFAVAMYSRKKLLKENFLIVLTSTLVSSVGGLFGTAAFVRAIKLGGSNGRFLRLSVLARNVTTALSMAITAMLGGDISIAASVVVLTGIFGATFVRRALDSMGIYDPITRGLAVGASSQGLGVSSMVSEVDAFPFAAMSMVLTAIAATILVSIPAIKDTLLKMC